MEVDFQPEMVGRQQELSELQAYLDEAFNGKGRAVFIAGEAGVGKSRLVNEIINVAESQGFQTLLGYSLGESLTPYMPFLDALRSGNLESLFAEEAPRVEAVYLVTHSGLLVKDMVRRETELSPDLFASMLSTVGEFVSESLSKFSGEEKEGMLNSLGYEDYQILIESGKAVNLVVILTGEKNEFLISDMRAALEDVTKAYGDFLKTWDGDDTKLRGIEEHLRHLILSGRYDGINYGKDDPETRRNLLFENVSLGIIRQARETPTLICIEDLQWADPSSLALMHYVARDSRKTGMLMIGTYRPEDVAVADGRGHPLTDTMQLMEREELCEIVELHRLPEETMEEFLRRLLGENDLDADFRKRVYVETEGNPLFMIQLIGYLLEENVIIAQNERWTLSRDLDEVDVPSRIFNVITRRLGRLEKEQRRVADFASVIGEVFTSGLLAQALNMDRVQLLELLRVLERTHRLVRAHDGGYRFDHAKVKEVLYDEIPEELRREYHSVIAGSLEELNRDDLDEVVGDLAFHYYQSKSNEKALFYLRRAAGKAKENYSNEEAIRFLEHILELEDSSEETVEILEDLGDLYDLIGKCERSIEVYESLLDMLEDDQSRARIYAKISGSLMKKGDYKESIEVCEKTLDLVKGKKSKEEALVLYNLGELYWNRAEWEKALGYYEQSCRIAEMTGDERQVVESAIGIGNSHYRMSEYDKALEQYEKSLKVAEEIGYKRGVGHSLNNLANIYADKGDAEKAIDYYERSLDLRKAIGDLWGIAASSRNLGDTLLSLDVHGKGLDYVEFALETYEKIGNQLYVAHVLTGIGNYWTNMGDYEKALEYHKSSLKGYSEGGDRSGLAVGLHNIGVVYNQTGDYDEALKYLKQSLEIRKEIQDEWGIAFAHNAMSTSYLEKGELEEALRHQNESLKIRKGINARPLTIRNYTGLAEIYVRKGEFAKATEFCKQARELSEEFGNRRGLSESCWISGMINSHLKNWENAIADFQNAIDILKELGPYRLLGQAYSEFGKMWKAKGDVAEAENYLRKGLDIFEKLKLTKDAEEPKAVLMDLGKSV